MTKNCILYSNWN